MGPPAVVRLQAGTCAEDRVRERACISMGDGQKQPGAAWASCCELASPLEKGTPKAMLHPKYGNAGWNAGLVSHTQLRLRTDGGTLGPTWGFLNYFKNGSNAMDTFAAAKGPKFKNYAPDFPARRAIRARQGELATGDVTRTGRVVLAARAGPSESKVRPNPPRSAVRY